MNEQKKAEDKIQITLEEYLIHGYIKQIVPNVPTAIIEFIILLLDDWIKHRRQWAAKVIWASYTKWQLRKELMIWLDAKVEETRQRQAKSRNYRNDEGPRKVMVRQTKNERARKEKERLIIEERERVKRRREEEEEKSRKEQKKIQEIDNRVELILNQLMERFDELSGKLDEIQRVLMQKKKRDEKVKVFENDNVEGVRIWLRDKVEMKQYIDVFLRNGVDKLSIVCLLDKIALKEMGIYKIGHQIVLLDQIQKLKVFN